MTINVRELLSKKQQECFDDIKNSRVLGASRHIGMIYDMILDMTEHRESATALLNDARELIHYFMATRGTQSRAVYNVLHQFEQRLSGMDQLEIQSLKMQMRELVHSTKLKADHETKTIISAVKQLSVNYQRVLVYDYSSTVEAVLRSLNPQIEVFVAESRALKGGYPFIAPLFESGHKIHFIPDMLIGDVMRSCQAVFIGAESFFPDGSLVNTIGSDVVALVAREWGVPLYVLTPMNKVDTRQREGMYRNSMMPYDFSNKIAATWSEELKSKIDFTGNKLVNVKASQITAYITEYGLVPPDAIYYVSDQYSKGENRV